MDNLKEVVTTDAKESSTFYKHAAEYWAQIPPTVDGMLGGFGFISHVDIQGSNHFLKQLFKLRIPPGKTRALDCGAGIGRITKNLLFGHFDTVDLVEQNPTFVEQARSYLSTHKKMGNFYCSGLQDFIPELATYDVIWCQWVLGHLTDDDLVAFLKACKRGLKPNGIIVVKENVTSDGKLEEDVTDSSVTRPLELLLQLLQRAGLRFVKHRRQEKFPHGLFPVYMIASRPVRNKSGGEVVLTATDAQIKLSNDTDNCLASPEDDVVMTAANAEMKFSDETNYSLASPEGDVGMTTTDAEINFMNAVEYRLAFPEAGDVFTMSDPEIQLGSETDYCLASTEGEVVVTAADAEIKSSNETDYHLASTEGEIVVTAANAEIKSSYETDYCLASPEGDVGMTTTDAEINFVDVVDHRLAFPEAEDVITITDAEIQLSNETDYCLASPTETDLQSNTPITSELEDRLKLDSDAEIPAIQQNNINLEISANCRREKMDVPTQAACE